MFQQKIGKIMQLKINMKTLEYNEINKSRKILKSKKRKDCRRISSYKKTNIKY